MVKKEYILLDLYIRMYVLYFLSFSVLEIETL